MLLGDEIGLAWALAEAVGPHLGVVECNNIHVAIAVGETFAAIHHLIASAADKRFALTPELVQRCSSWLDAYTGHEDELRLRGLLVDTSA